MKYRLLINGNKNEFESNAIKLNEATIMALLGVGTPKKRSLWRVSKLNLAKRTAESIAGSVPINRNKLKVLSANKLIEVISL